MNLTHLGEQIDIHGGGNDLIFPHHENEIAQTESYTGKKPFVKYWMHNGLLRLGDEKMSKSLGNIISIKEALGKYSADALRIFILGSHYRSPLTYSQDAVEAAEKGADRLRQALEASTAGGKQLELDLAAYRQRFIEAMDDDFNTPQALAVLFDMTRELNRLRDEGCDISAAQELLREFGGVLGLTFKPMQKTLSVSDDEIQKLVDERTAARKARQFEKSDEIRKQLDSIGVVIEDTPQGTVWKARR
jgi:cysteinyl-tRNA synthetase